MILQRLPKDPIGKVEIMEARASAATADARSSACHCPDHGPRKPLDTGALVSARGLGIVRQGRIVIEDVDVDLHKGEIVTLIGPNGSGKTTLVRLLLGLEAPGEGEIRRAPGLTVGYVPQRFDIDRAMPMTVTRFLTLGNGMSQRKARAVLDEVGAGRVAGQQLCDLSGGELQRVLLARALLGEPQLLVLDEPVRGVDTAGEAELYALIARLRDERGVGVLLVSHDLHVVMAKSDRVLCLNRHICCSGVPDDVAQHPEYMRLFGGEMGQALAVYRHRHDHRHDIDGAAHADGAGLAAEPRSDGEPN